MHALRNVTAKLPERHHRELKARWWSAFDDATSPADAQRGLQAIIADYRTAYPSAMAVIERDLDALIAHLRWPTEGERFAERALSAATTCRRQKRSLFGYLAQLLAADSRGDPLPALT